MDVQDSLAATKTICLSDLVAASNLLRSLKGSYLRADTGSMKTTPTEALETALSLTSLDLGVNGASRFTAHRLSSRGEWRNRGFGHTKLEFLQKYPFALKQDRILKEYRLVRQYEYKVLKPTKEDWCMPGKSANPKV